MNLESTEHLDLSANAFIGSIPNIFAGMKELSKYRIDYWSCSTYLGLKYLP